jgi:hypothetical protein
MTDQNTLDNTSDRDIQKVRRVFHIYLEHPGPVQQIAQRFLLIERQKDNKGMWDVTLPQFGRPETNSAYNAKSLVFDRSRDFFRHVMSEGIIHNNSFYPPHKINRIDFVDEINQ